MLTRELLDSLRDPSDILVASEARPDGRAIWADAILKGIVRCRRRDADAAMEADEFDRLRRFVAWAKQARGYVLRAEPSDDAFRSVRVRSVPRPAQLRYRALSAMDGASLNHYLGGVADL